MKAHLRLAGLLSLAVGVLYWPAIGGGGVFFQRDVYNYWRPHVDWALLSLARGESIAWNPGMQFGMPFLADPNFQVFYPPTWLLLVLSPERFYTAMVVGHAIFAGLGGARLAKGLGFEKGALSAGVAMALSGPLVSMANLWHHYCGAAWIPWIVWSVRRLALSEGRDWRGCAGTVGLAALAGSAESVAMAIVLAGLTEGRSLVRPAVTRALLQAAVVAALIGSVQWLPTWNVLQSSARSQFSAEEKLAWSLPPSSLPHLVTAGPHPSRQRAVENGSVTLIDDDVPLIATPYLGAFLLPFALFGAWRRPALGASAVIFLLGSLGRHLPAALASLLTLLPFRYPTKLLAALAVTVAVLAGAGVHAALSDRRRASRLVSLFLALGLVALAALGSSAAGRSGPLPSVALLTLGAIAAFAPPHEALIVGGFFIDLLTGTAWVNQYATPAIFHYRPPAVDVVLRLDPRPRIFSMYPGEIWAQDDLNRSGRGTSANFAAAVTEIVFPPHGLSFGIRHAFQTEFSGLGVPEVKAWEAFRGVHFEADPRRYLSLGAISAVVSTDNTNPLGTATPLARFQGALSSAVRVDPWGVVSRAGLPKRVLATRTAVESMRAVASPDFRPGLDVALEGAGDARSGSEQFQGGEVTILRDENDVVDLTVNSNGPGLLVLRDTFRAGWSATVDGLEAPIARADVLFRAVRVPPGRSRVIFRYDTPGLRLGVLLLLGGIAILAVPRKSRIP